MLARHQPVPKTRHSGDRIEPVSFGDRGEFAEQRRSDRNAGGVPLIKRGPFAVAWGHHPAARLRGLPAKIGRSLTP